MEVSGLKVGQRSANRFRKFGLYLIFSVSILGFSVQAMANTLTIETKTTVAVTGDLLRVRVTAKNKGDVPAHDVQVHLILLGDEQIGPVRDQLNKGQSETVPFEKVLPGLKKGRYPLIVLVDFHDANGYPFSAVSCTTFHFIEDTAPDLVCSGKAISIEKNGLLSFKAKNLGLGSKTVQVSLILPKELSTPMPQMDLEVDPGKEKMVTFEINNFSALPGASYPVFCYLEYDLKETHYAVLATALVKIAKDENWFRRTRWVWITLTAILTAIFVIIMVRDRKTAI